MLQNLPDASRSLKNVLDTEWTFTKGICPYIIGGEAEAGKRFRYVAYNSTVIYHRGEAEAGKRFRYVTYNSTVIYRAPDKLHICIFYAIKTSKNACIIRSECTHYAYILLCKQTFQIRSVLVRC